ncbi:MAG: hypothetical protein AAGF98_16100 [Cyanobacteria bacterium P01_H01_bin.153]
MSAALKTESVSSRPQPAPVSAVRQRSLRVVERPVAASVIVPLQDKHERPLWLKLLVAGQRASLVVAGLTVTGALSAYALTVDANRRLTSTTAMLGHLQDHQQQLIKANAVFKNHLAQTAIAAMNDGTLHPKDVIFLETVEPVEPRVAPPAADPAARVSQRIFPKGY